MVSSQIYSQELTQLQIDSLFTKFLHLRAPELLPQTDKPVELTPEDRKCGFGIVNSIKSNIDLFSQEQQNVLKPFFSRPFLQTSVVSPSGFFRIHYDANGINRPSYVSTWSVEQNVAEVANALDSSYRFEVTYLGFLAPPSDGNGGSDNKYDVYIQNQGGGIYGYTEWESKVGSVNWTSFMVIDNDYIGYYSTGLNGMKVTVAHEFHHGIQVGNYSVLNGTSPLRSSDGFFYELTSTSMEEFVYDDVNDYYAYMGSYFNNTDVAMANQNGYNLAIWNLYLTAEYGQDAGFGILKRQWEMIPSTAAILAINHSLNEVSTSFARELNRFGIWTFFTSHRRIPGNYFEEAANYPLISPTFTIPFPSPPPGNLEAAPTSNNFLLFNVSSRSDSLFAVITNGDAFASSSGPKFPYEYILYADSSIGSRKLSENYSSDFSTSNMNYWSVSEILNNILVREDTSQVPIVKTSDIFIFPNPVYYSRIPSRGVFIAFETKGGEEVDFNVYSIGMELKLSSTIITKSTQTEDFKTFTGINWDGLDKNKNKLDSGIYICVIKNGDEVIKGKVVIFNE